MIHVWSACSPVLNDILTCRNEREKYAKHRHKAEKYPSKYISIIIDGMDQDKTNIPHLISTPKALAGNYTLETHVTGVRVHGRSTMMFIDCQQFPHDSNLTIELLSQVFLKYKVSHIIHKSSHSHEDASVNKFVCLLCRTTFQVCSIYRWITLAEIIKTSTL